MSSKPHIPLRRFRDWESINRAYGIFLTRAGSLVGFGLLCLLFCTVTFFLIPETTGFMAYSAKLFLGSNEKFEGLRILNKEYLFQPIQIISLSGTFPTPWFCLISFLCSTLGIIFVFLVKTIPRPLATWMTFLFLINAVSSAFFILAPEKFPYSLDDFSESYVKMEVGLWLFIPVLMNMALSFLSMSWLARMVMCAVAQAYSVLFGAVRYVIFLYVLHLDSHLFMPLLFFGFGPLLDFIYVVGLYSWGASFALKRVKMV